MKTLTGETPFQAALDHDAEGVVRREIVTYRIREGAMIKEQITRDFYKNGDYHDTLNSMPLVQR